MTYEEFCKKHIQNNRYFIDLSKKSGTEYRVNEIFEGEPVIIFVDDEFIEIRSVDRFGDYATPLFAERLSHFNF